MLHMNSQLSEINYQPLGSEESIPSTRETDAQVNAANDVLELDDGACQVTGREKKYIYINTHPPSNVTEIKRTVLAEDRSGIIPVDHDIKKTLLNGQENAHTRERRGMKLRGTGISSYKTRCAGLAVDLRLAGANRSALRQPPRHGGKAKKIPLVSAALG
jgi:hypothetical protein